MCKVEKANELFLKGYSCSQAIFTAYAEEFEVGEKISLKISSSFGGGVGGRKELCGAVSGALMVIGLKYGRDKAEDTESKNINYFYVNEYIKRFKDYHKTIICKEILDEFALDGQNKNQLPRHGCIVLISNAAKILEEILTKDREIKNK